MWCNVVNEAGGRALPTGPGGVALQIAHCDVLNTVRDTHQRGIHWDDLLQCVAGLGLPATRGSCRVLQRGAVTLVGELGPGGPPGSLQQIGA